MSDTRPHHHALAVELTSACNQKCAYCYNAWREDDGREVGALPSATLIALLDRTLSEVHFDHLTFTGGEPFSRRDLFDILDVCVRHQTPFQMISNGGLITDAHAARLATYKPLSVQVTLNAPQAAMHDEVVGGEGHFDRTLRGIRALTKHGIRVVGCVVVTRKNASLVGETLDLFASLGVRSISFSRFSPSGYSSTHAAALLPSRTDILIALEAANTRAEVHGLSIQSTMPIPPCVVEPEDYPRVRFGSCPIGTSTQEFVLGPRGELRNCTLHEAPLGDAKTESIADVLRSSAVMHYRDVTPEFCAPCPHASTCMGGCGAASLALTGVRGLDPFVAQHVDPAMAAQLAEARRNEGHIVSAASLVRR